jgi:hypothetical protein
MSTLSMACNAAFYNKPLAFDISHRAQGLEYRYIAWRSCAQKEASIRNGSTNWQRDWRIHRNDAGCDG